MRTLRAAWSVAAKELREGFRDKQTVFSTFLLPVCLYPALFWVMVQGALLVRGQRDATDVGVVVHAPAPLHEALRDALTGEPGEPGERSGADAADDVPFPAGALRVETRDGRITAEEARAALVLDEDLGAVLDVPQGRSDDAPAILYLDSTRSKSRIAEERVADGLSEWSEELRLARARELGVAPELLEPLSVRTQDLATSAEEGALGLSLVLPMLLVLMTVMGAFFPAVDSTAGEKERRTAETTLLLPLPRASIHLGKILAVSVSGMIATALNLIALGLSAEHLLGQLGAGVEIELPVGALLAVAPLALLFTFFVSAVLTGVASLAASFKEGQAMLGPVQMLFIFPAMGASMPGLELNAITAFVPVINVALAFRELLVGSAEALPVALTALALAGYAAAAVWLAVRLLTRESVALARESLSLKRLRRLMRSSGDTR